MTPVCEVSIAGEIIDFGGRLVSLSIVQDRERYVGIGCDSLELILEDTRDARLIIPPRGRALKVKIGYAGQPLVDKGIYIVDESEIEGPPARLIIRAQNNPKTPHSDQYNPITTRVSRSWPQPLTVQDMVTQIAIDHGLFPVISPSLASIPLPHIDQSDMTDLELLEQRVARIHDAFVLVQDSRLIVAKNGSGQTVNDVEIPNIMVYQADVGGAVDPEKTYLTSWRARFTDFIRYETVVASWYDAAAAKYVEERAGNGNAPTLRIPFVQPDQVTAMATARAALNRSNCSTGELSVSFPGVPQLFAGGRLFITGAHPDLDQSSWYARRVVHTIDRGGFTTQADGERLTSDAVAEMSENG